jgi:hypothetical protein
MQQSHHRLARLSALACAALFATACQAPPAPEPDPTPCATGSFQSDEGPPEACAPCRDECSPGTHELTACSPTQDRICEPCSAGTVDHDEDPSTACVGCATCAPGSHETSACLATQQRVCEACDDGTFDEDNDPLTACTPCQTCAPGTLETQSCTATQDRACEACGENTFDSDSDPQTACVGCTSCAAGTSQTADCSPVENRVCQTCEPGTVDRDADPVTACEDCTVCGEEVISIGVCSPTEDVACHPCLSNPTGANTLIDLQGDPFANCPEHDPTCAQGLDVVYIVDTATLNGVFGGEIATATTWAEHQIMRANEVAHNSLLPPDMRFRLAGVVHLPITARGESLTTVFWMRFNPEVQAIRRSVGADIALFLSDTNAGFTGYAYHIYGQSVQPERGVAIARPNTYANGEICGRMNVQQLLTHEMGHLLGGTHNRGAFSGSSGASINSYGYNNQEVYFRRNEAFGLPVSQHGKALYTVMSYGMHRPGPNGDQTGCPACTKLPVFSSTDLWWFHDVNDELNGYCLVVGSDEAVVQLICTARETPWVWLDGSYQLNPEAVIEIQAQTLIDRAVPLGVDEASFVHPETQEVMTDTGVFTRMRDRAMAIWPSRAQAAAPLDPTAVDRCGEGQRTASAVGEEACGDCLPGWTEHDGACYGRIEAAPDNPLHDGRFDPTTVFAPARGESVQADVSLASPSTLTRVDLFLGTVDEQGVRSYAWSQMSGGITRRQPAPEHSFSLHARHGNGDLTALGDALTAGAIQKDWPRQLDHSLTYFFELDQALEDVVAIELVLHSGLPENDGDPAFGISVYELRVFGVPTP